MSRWKVVMKMGDHFIHISYNFIDLLQIVYQIVIKLAKTRNIHVSNE